ncbi:hypothetical protein AAFF_G00436040 [Aldrovandia affinis]|uniref:Uncharacterized protein n=1 Tax=Aldrovandia affinis TaxID=143900 RepID=A0AAD7WI80_9TELE|nr:hypothetical protein AAFF_G00436040 [Aldrovandia affinis]
MWSVGRHGVGQGGQDGGETEKGERLVPANCLYSVRAERGAFPPLSDPPPRVPNSQKLIQLPPTDGLSANCSTQAAAPAAGSPSHRFLTGLPRPAQQSPKPY